MLYSFAHLSTMPVRYNKARRQWQAPIGVAAANSTGTAQMRTSLTQTSSDAFIAHMINDAYLLAAPVQYDNARRRR